MNTKVDDSQILDLLAHDTERGRYLALQARLESWSHLYVDQPVFDFGCSWGTSAVALTQSGARNVVGVDPDLDRVERGHALVEKLGLSDLIELRQHTDSSQLPWPDSTFSFVLANGVIEHIPRHARPAIMREVWRVLAPGGHFMIAETPNSYYPKDEHTTQLWFNHWLPEQMAHTRAVRAQAFRANRTDWDSSGWRGAGYYELLRPLKGAKLLPEPITRARQRFLAMLGLPPMLIDPWPLWVFRKT